MQKVAELPVADTDPSGMFVHNSKLYCGFYNAPARVAKIDLGTFTVDGYITDGSFNWICAADYFGNFGYFVADWFPIMIMKVDLTTFTEVGTLGLSENTVFGNIILCKDGYAYVASNTSPGKLIKIDLTTFTEVDKIAFPAGHRYPRSITADDTYLYVVNQRSFLNRIERVRISDFTYIDFIDITADDVCRFAKVAGANLYAGVFGYAGAMSRIKKVRLSDFTIIDTLDLAPLADQYGQGVYDLVNNFLYTVGKNTYPTSVRRIDLSSFTQTAQLDLLGDGTVENPSIAKEGNFMYLGINIASGVYGGAIDKINLSDVTVTCPSAPKYSGDTVTLKATPKDGTGPYYVEFKKGTTVIALSSNVIENTDVTYDYILTDTDIAGSDGTITFSVFISDSCPLPLGPKTCDQTCIITIGCIAPVCNFIVT